MNNTAKKRLKKESLLLESCLRKSRHASGRVCFWSRNGKLPGRLRSRAAKSLTSCQVPISLDKVVQTVLLLSMLIFLIYCSRNCFGDILRLV